MQTRGDSQYPVGSYTWPSDAWAHAVHPAMLS